MLALVVLIVVPGRVASLHTLRVLRGVWQREQLLLELCRDVDTGQVCGLSAHSNLLTCLVAEEDALLGGVGGWVHAGDARSVAVGRVDGKGAIDVTARLVEFDGLPGVLGGLADAGTVCNALVLLVVARVVLLVDVAFDLILAESQR